MALKIPFNAVQKALYELLLKGQTVPVTEHIPTGQEEFPYKEIGNWQESENMLKHELKRYAKTRNSERLMEQEVSTTVTDINTLLR